MCEVADQMLRKVNLYLNRWLTVCIWGRDLNKLFLLQAYCFLVFLCSICNNALSPFKWEPYESTDSSIMNDVQYAYSSTLTRRSIIYLEDIYLGQARVQQEPQWGGGRGPMWPSCWFCEVESLGGEIWVNLVLLRLTPGEALTWWVQISVAWVDLRFLYFSFDCHSHLTSISLIKRGTLRKDSSHFDDSQYDVLVEITPKTAKTTWLFTWLQDRIGGTLF
jgi:hypothetical protein